MIGEFGGPAIQNPLWSKQYATSVLLIQMNGLLCCIKWKLLNKIF